MTSGSGRRSASARWARSRATSTRACAKWCGSSTTCSSPSSARSAWSSCTTRKLLRRMLDVDLTAEIPQTPHEAADGLSPVAAREVIGSEVAVRHAVAEHVVARAEHGGCDGEDGFLGAAPGLDAQELCWEVGVLGADGGPGRRDERGLEPRGARAHPGRAALSGTLVGARAQPRPGDEVGGGGEASHVDADLGDEDMGDGVTDARHRHQEAGLLPDRRQGFSHGGLELCEGRLAWIDEVQVQREQGAVMGVTCPRSASTSAACFWRAVPGARAARRSGSVSPAMSAASIARPLLPRMLDRTPATLRLASSRTFWMRRACWATSRTNCFRVRVRSRSAWMRPGG